MSDIAGSSTSVGIAMKIEPNGLLRHVADNRHHARREPKSPERDTATVELLAVSTGVAIAYGVGLWVVLIIGPATVTALKGQWPLFDAGFHWAGLVWWIAAFRLARPESWWARHLYGPAKLARAQARYPETLDEEEGIDGEPDPPWVPIATALFLALCGVAAILAVGGLLGL